jgi:DTW domain-containing protein YfiP
MHPREFKRQRTGTGRVTRKSLTNSTILVGVDFTHHEELNRALGDTSYFPVLLFPGAAALPADSAAFRAAAGARPALIVILDATWASARKMLNSSTNLQQLPRISFELKDPSRFVIKRQPAELCLSTIEAVYRLLDAFDQNGIERLEGRHLALMETLESIVQFQLDCAADPDLPSHRIPDRISK